MSDETQETGVNSNEAADASAPAEQAAADAPEVKDEPIEEELPAPPVADADIVELTQRRELAESLLAAHEKFLLTLPEYKFFLTRHM